MSEKALTAFSLANEAVKINALTKLEDMAVLNASNMEEDDREELIADLQRRAYGGEVINLDETGDPDADEKLRKLFGG